MIASIYSVKDELSGKFHNPMFIATSETAEEEMKRIFRTHVNNTPIWKENPSDFSLWYIGAMDDSTAEIRSELKKICDGRSVING